MMQTGWFPADGIAGLEGVMGQASALKMAIAAAAIVAGIAAVEPARATEFFQPFGANDRIAVDREPSLNSAQDRFNEQVDIYQSEINRSQRERAYWDTYMRNNLLDHSRTNELPYAREY
jgi:hypothetical protein